MISKKLLAVAVAGALSVPALAFAQSSVTISGVLKVGLDNLNIGSANAARAGKNTSEMRVTDNSSRIIFGMTEDLGNGLAAIGQIDVRFSTDIGANGYAVSPTNVGATTMSAGGNTWVGLRSKTMGTVILGRQDLHYGLFELNEIASKAGALMATSVSLFDFIQGTAIAGGTRTNNVIMYDTPVWSGFSVRAAWSANPTNVETDLSSTSPTRKGQAWNFNPKYDAGNWGLRYSYWNQKSDAGSSPGSLTSSAAPCTAAQTAAGGGAVGASCLTVTGATTPADQRGDTALGWVAFGGLKVGLGWNKSRLTNATSGAETNSRTAWTIPVTYVMGPHNVYFHYTKANADKDTAGNDGAKMWALAYVYDLSKRTSLGLTLSQITNDANASYNFFTNAASGQFGSVGGVALAGEKPRLIAATVRHAF